MSKNLKVADPSESEALEDGAEGSNGGAVAPPMAPVGDAPVGEEAGDDAGPSVAGATVDTGDSMSPMELDPSEPTVTDGERRRASHK